MAESLPNWQCNLVVIVMEVNYNHDMVCRIYFVIFTNIYDPRKEVLKAQI